MWLITWVTSETFTRSDSLQQKRNCWSWGATSKQTVLLHMSGKKRSLSFFLFFRWGESHGKRFAIHFLYFGTKQSWNLRIQLVMGLVHQSPENIDKCKNQLNLIFQSFQSEHFLDSPFKSHEDLKSHDTNGYCRFFRVVWARARS